MWYSMPIIPTLGRLGQEDCEFDNLSLFLDASIILLQKPFFFLALVVIVTKIV
jgi:hypothetical protein